MSSFDSAAGLNVEVLDGLRSSFIADKSSKVLQNALAHSSIGNVTLNNEVVQNTDASFSTKLDKWSVTNQKSSGRCWLFAYLNVWRVNAMTKMNLKEFEFSQNYLFFWDKLERVNQFCEAMIETSG
jgi:bleomycin hydrolase